MQCLPDEALRWAQSLRPSVSKSRGALSAHHRAKGVGAMDLPQYSIVSNSLSFGIATFGAATAFFWLNRSQVDRRYRTAVTVSGIVTLVAFYHYFRMFESFGHAFEMKGGAVVATGTTFNDAYRYVDWLLTVPLLVAELILVMGLSAVETRSRILTLGGAAAAMVLLGYPGEVAADAGTRWLWWGLAMIPFLYIVFTLYTGLGESIARQPDGAKGLIELARNVTIVSWCFYPIVFILPMIGLAAAGSVNTYVQVGYTISDIIAKAGYGVLIYQIAVAKSTAHVEEPALA
jgi:bacteriorhodopsin